MKILNNIVILIVRNKQLHSVNVITLIQVLLYLHNATIELIHNETISVFLLIQKLTRIHENFK